MSYTPYAFICKNLNTDKCKGNCGFYGVDREPVCFIEGEPEILREKSLK